MTGTKDGVCVVMVVMVVVVVVMVVVEECVCIYFCCV